MTSPTNHGYSHLNSLLTYITIALTLVASTVHAQYSISGRVTDQATGQCLPFVDIYENSNGQLTATNDDGQYQLQYLPTGTYQLIVQSLEYNTDTLTVRITDSDVILDIALTKLSSTLTAVEISARRKELFALTRLRAVEGTAIYEGKKTEVVLLDEIVGNLAANNARQIYAQVAGLNIYEGSDAGLQLNIGGRGLDPNRTANFNTRQNGYDISADVLGYPESYYTPPAEALSQIQVVRGAASLQYGTQFGGLVNFKMKTPPANKPVTGSVKQTIGSYGLLTTYADVGGTSGKLSYFGYYNYKKGDGYRPFSGYASHNAYAHIGYQYNDRTKISLEGTYLHYLAQQAGGLTDSQFAEDARMSTRQRNWFEVDWRLYNFKLTHLLTDRTTLDVSLFGLSAARRAVGYRGDPLDANSSPITAIDEQTADGSYLNPRDLILGTFANWGAESRLLHRYQLLGRKAIALLGAKLYVANNTATQGPGSLGADADFSLQSATFPDYANQSSFDFPNTNAAIFGEHILQVSEKLSLTPGARLEHIKTESEGSYEFRRFDAAGNPIFRELLRDDRVLERTLLLLGIGTSYKPSKQLEMYANLSQNYRSVTFSDIRTVNPTFIIDPDISDERGYTGDIGIRGRVGSQLSYDAGIFGLRYANRIGIILDDRANRVRGNIGAAIIYGLESYVEWNITKSIDPELTNRLLSVYANTALTGSRYTSSDDNNIEGKTVEFIPRLNLKTGIKLGYKDLLVAAQLTHLSEQYTDAENSEPAGPGDQREGIIGTIPAYSIADVSASYVLGSWTVSTGLLNILNNQYYTRRATGYPGPGIIPSDGRSVYVTLGYRW